MVEMDGSDDHMRDACVVGQQWQQRVAVALGVVDSLMIDDQAWASRRREKLGWR